MSLKSLPDPSPHEPPATTRSLEAYVLDALLARGRLASVQLARGPAGSQPPVVVIKRLREPSSAESALRTEAYVLRRVSSPYVVRLLDEGSSPAPFLVLEYVEGLSLHEVLELAPAPARLRHVIPAVTEALRGLQTLHEAGVFHQAPCARHIMLDVNGQTKLVDLSHATHRDVPQHDARLSPSEMAPEQVIAPAQVDARCDVFIAGLTLWEALTGQRPFAEASGEEAVQQLLRAPIPAPIQVSATSPAHFDRLLERALARAPWKRFGSAGEMADALEDTARRHGLFATQDERASWLRTLIATAAEQRAPRRASVRAVVARSGITSFVGATSAPEATSAPGDAAPRETPTAPPAAPAAPSTEDAGRVRRALRESPLPQVRAAAVAMLTEAEPRAATEIPAARDVSMEIDISIEHDALDRDPRAEEADAPLAEPRSNARMAGGVALTLATAVALVAGATALRARVEHRAAQPLRIAAERTSAPAPAPAAHVAQPAPLPASAALFGPPTPASRPAPKSVQAVPALKPVPAAQARKPAQTAQGAALRKPPLRPWAAPLKPRMTKPLAAPAARPPLPRAVPLAKQPAAKPLLKPRPPAQAPLGQPRATAGSLPAKPAPARPTTAPEAPRWPEQPVQMPISPLGVKPAQPLAAPAWLKPEAPAPAPNPADPHLPSTLSTNPF